MVVVVEVVVTDGWTSKKTVDVALETPPCETTAMLMVRRPDVLMTAKLKYEAVSNTLLYVEALPRPTVRSCRDVVLYDAVSVVPTVDTERPSREPSRALESEIVAEVSMMSVGEMATAKINRRVLAPGSKLSTLALFETGFRNCVLRTGVCAWQIGSSKNTVRNTASPTTLCIYKQSKMSQLGEQHPFGRK